MTTPRSNRSTRRGLAAALALTIAGALPVAAAADEATGYRWLLVGERAHVDRSTKMLANGFDKSARRHAVRALRGELSPLAELVARHNLCIAHTRLGEPEQAAAHCAAVTASELPPVHVTPRGKGFVAVSETGTAIAPGELLGSNLALAGAGTEADRIAASD